MRRSAAVAIVLALLAPSAVAAQGVCVDCKGPDRSYRCTVKDSERVQNVRGGARAIEFVCISEIARIGGHQACRVNTSYSGPCIGQHHEIDVATLGQSAAVVVGRPPEGAETKDGAAAGSAAAPAAQPQPAKKGPPQTLEELARDTVSKSKEQLDVADEKVRKAGDAVGGAVRKTWDCLASLFSRC